MAIDRYIDFKEIVTDKETKEKPIEMTRLTTMTRSTEKPPESNPVGRLILSFVVVVVMARITEWLSNMKNADTQKPIVPRIKMSNQSLYSPVTRLTEYFSYRFNDKGMIQKYLIPLTIPNVLKNDKATQSIRKQIRHRFPTFRTCHNLSIWHNTTDLSFMLVRIFVHTWKTSKIWTISNSANIEWNDRIAHREKRARRHALLPSPTFIRRLCVPIQVSRSDCQSFWWLRLEPETSSYRISIIFSLVEIFRHTTIRWQATASHLS